MPGSDAASTEAPADPGPPSTQLDSRARLDLTVRRGVQFGIDLGITALGCLIPLALTALIPRNPDDTLRALLVVIPMLLLAMVVSVVLSWWYWARLPVRRGGRTLAMGWLGLRVVGVDGDEVSSTRLAVRWLLLLVDGLGFGLVGLVAMLVTPRGQRFGDLFADTVVVRAARREDVAPAADGTLVIDPARD